MKKRYIALLLVIVLLGVWYYLSTFKLQTLYIVGCNNIDQETIRQEVLARNTMDNTFFTYWKLKAEPIEDVPFLAKIDYEIASKNQLKITVYEKSLAGCVDFMNCYVYFDKDGIVLEASERLIEGVPCINGLSFDQCEIGKKLPIDDEKKFQLIISITQLVEKYNLQIDSVTFTEDNEIVLSHDKINIELGEGEYLAIQLMNLGSILEGLEGLEGTLYMKDFDSDNATASFSKK